MPIQATDIVLRYSAPGATSGGSLASGVGNSLGKYCSNTAIPDAVLDNLFPDLTGDENTSDNVDYQCVFVHNTHATLTLIGPILWIVSSGIANTSKAIGLDTTAASSYTSATAQAVTVANKNTAPAGVSFSAPTSKATGLAIGDLPAGEVKAFWVRRTATNSAAANNDSVQVRVEGDTLA